MLTVTYYNDFFEIGQQKSTLASMNINRSFKDLFLIER